MHIHMYRQTCTHSYKYMKDAKRIMCFYMVFSNILGVSYPSPHPLPVIPTLYIQMKILKGKQGNRKQKQRKETSESSHVWNARRKG